MIIGTLTIAKKENWREVAFLDLFQLEPMALILTVGAVAFSAAFYLLDLMWALGLALLVIVSVITSWQYKIVEVKKNITLSYDNTKVYFNTQVTSFDFSLKELYKLTFEQYRLQLEVYPSNIGLRMDWEQDETKYTFRTNLTAHPTYKPKMATFLQYLRSKRVPFNEYDEDRNNTYNLEHDKLNNIPSEYQNLINQIGETDN